jgi:NAD(P)-dependent dehydrogenase (short-subunit alcohol dehydrogenase family)
VNVVCPGRIDNEEFQLGAEMLGAEQPEPKSYLNFSALFDVSKEREAVANMVAYLASDEGNFIHAQSYSFYDDETTSIRNLATTNWEE